MIYLPPIVAKWAEAGQFGLREEVVNVVDDRSLPFEERAYENYRDEMKDVREIAVLVETRERTISKITATVGQ